MDFLLSERRDVAAAKAFFHDSPRPGNRPKFPVLWELVYNRAQHMTETLSIRLDTETKKRLEALAQRSRRSKSFLAAEAIAQYVESEEWQLGEIRVGIADLDAGRSVSHEKVARWLKSWGKSSEGKPPR